jgi:hypothetical protein
MEEDKMKKCIAILLIATLCLGIVACSGKTEEVESDKGLVGFCSVSLSESIYVLEQKALENIFAGKAEVQTVSCDNDSAVQISQIKSFALMGADLIIINPTDIDALSDVIIEAHNAGCKIYINGATSDSLDEKYYDCCTVSDEYLCGAYVALSAKNWIESHAEMLSATGDWELAFLTSSLSEETLKRSYGEQSILEPYLKDWEGNYVDAAGNIVQESKKVENPAYCALAKEHFKGVTVEQDQQNGGLNVASVLTTNPNTRVFIAYNSLASTQGGQYIVDHYPDNLDEFAFFSAGVMGNEADYMVGAVSKTDGVTPAIMRGACQFGVSAAGGEVADSVARTAFAVMYGQEGVDYSKRNPDGIAAWWTVDEKQGSGTAYVAHFNIFSGATVQAFDPIEALKNENTVIYWNSKDGFILDEKEEAPDPSQETPDPSQETPGPEQSDIETVAGVYSFAETTPFGEVPWIITLNEDGSFVIEQENEVMGNPSWTGTKWIDHGNGTFTTVAAQGEGAQIADFWQKDGSITWINNGDGTLTPGPEQGSIESIAGEYSFTETTPFGEIGWIITLNEDGSFLIEQPENEGLGNPSWTGTEWIDHGDGTFTTVAAQGEGPQIASFWQQDGSITWKDNGDGTLTPVE